MALLGPQWQKVSSMDFPVQCDCGKQFVATDAMAGTRIPCGCGRQVSVPSLGEIRRQSQGDKLSPPAALPADSVWQGPTAILYGLALAWTCFVGLPLIALCFLRWGPVAGLGALLVYGGLFWLFTL